MGGYARVVSGQRLGKHVPVARQQILIILQLEYDNGTAVFSIWPVPRDTLDEMPSIFIRDKLTFSSERILHKGYYHRS
jgi:hypothetical protein